MFWSGTVTPIVTKGREGVSQSVTWHFFKYYNKIVFWADCIFLLAIFIIIIYNFKKIKMSRHTRLFFWGEGYSPMSPNVTWGGRGLKKVKKCHLLFELPFTSFTIFLKKTNFASCKHVQFAREVNYPNCLENCWSRHKSSKLRLKIV